VVFALCSSGDAAWPTNAFSDAPNIIRPVFRTARTEQQIEEEQRRRERLEAVWRENAAREEERREADWEVTSEPRLDPGFRRRAREVTVTLSERKRVIHAVAILASPTLAPSERGHGTMPLEDDQEIIALCAEATALHAALDDSNPNSLWGVYRARFSGQ
jgi:hypothetical protein